MKNLSPKTLAMLTAGFLAAVCLLSAVFILVSPDDQPQMMPDNSSGNLLAGGAFVGDDAIAYFAHGGQVYSLFDGRVTPLCEGAAPLFATNGGVAYMKDGNLCQYLTDSHTDALLAEQPTQPLIIGRWIYRTEDGEVVKTRMDDGKTYRLGLKTSRPFTISTTLIYYIGADGYLYSAKTDGRNATRQTDEPVQDFIIGGNHIFYRNGEGVLCWFAAATPQAKVEYKTVDAYHYVDAKLVYAKDGALCTYDMSGSMAEKTLLTEFSGEVYCDENAIYLLDEGKLTRMSPDGGGETVYKAENAK